MHDLAFRFKRAHLTAVALHKRLIASWCRQDLRVYVVDVGLTPARFDAMVVIRALGGSCLQSELWQQLGLHASTICKMLKRMELAGLVTRSEGLDRRERYVELTKKGLEVTIGALEKFVRSNAMHDLYAAMHRRGAEFIGGVIETLRHLGRALRDSSTHAYPVAPLTDEHVQQGEAWDDVVRRQIGAEPADAAQDAGLPDYFSPEYWGKHHAEINQGGAIAEAARERLERDTAAVVAAADARLRAEEEKPPPDIYDPEYWGKHHAEINQGGAIAEAARERLRRDMARAHGDAADTPDISSAVELASPSPAPTGSASVAEHWSRTPS